MASDTESAAVGTVPLDEYYRDCNQLRGERDEARETIEAVREWRKQHGLECNGRSEMSDLDAILEVKGE